LPDHRGIGVAVVDGHESHASYLRHCPGCLERTIHTGKTERTQFYHRHADAVTRCTAGMRTHTAPAEL
jgi:hypothetical protein